MKNWEELLLETFLKYFLYREMNLSKLENSENVASIFKSDEC